MEELSYEQLCRKEMFDVLKGVFYQFFIFIIFLIVVTSLLSALLEKLSRKAKGKVSKVSKVSKWLVEVFNQDLEKSRVGKILIAPILMLGWAGGHLLFLILFIPFLSVLPIGVFTLVELVVRRFYLEKWPAIEELSFGDFGFFCALFFWIPLFLILCVILRALAPPSYSEQE